MAMKDVIPSRPLRVGVKLLLAAIALFLLDFAIWYVADLYRFKYESIVFVAIFVALFLSSLRKADKSKVFVNKKLGVGDVVAFLAGTGAVCFVIAMVVAIPVAVFPNWFGLVVIFFGLTTLGRMKSKSKPIQGA